MSTGAHLATAVHQRLGIALSPQAATQFLADGTGCSAEAAVQGDVTQLVARILVADLHACGSACLPGDLKGWQNKILRGRFVLQIDEISNIAVQIRDRSARTCRYHEASSARCLKLLLTDGVQQVAAVELEPIPGLASGTPAGCKIAVTDADVRRGMLMLRARNVAVLNGQVDALEAARQRMLEAWRLPAKGNRQRDGAQASYFAGLSTAAWPSGAGVAAVARPAVQVAASAAQPGGPAPPAAAVAGTGGAINPQQPAATAPDTRQDSIAPLVDRRERDTPPAAAVQGQPQRAARATTVSRPLADDLPTLPSPDVIQISSGSSEGAAEAPAAMRSPMSGPSPLEDCLTSGRSSRGKRSQPESGHSAGDADEAGPCHVRRRVVLDSNTERSRPAASHDAQGSTGRNRGGPGYERQEVHQAELRTGVPGEGEDCTVLSSRHGQTVQQLPTLDCLRMTAGTGSAPGIGRFESDAVYPGAVADTAGRQADVVGDAYAEVTVMRLVELVECVALARGAAESSRRVRALDCSVMKMPKPIRFKDGQDDNIVPLDRYCADLVIIEDGTMACNAKLHPDLVQRLLGGVTPADLCQTLRSNGRESVTSLFMELTRRLSAYMGPMELLVVDQGIEVVSLDLAG